MAGILCFEAEWQIANSCPKLSTNTEPLMKFISEEFSIPYIYRRIATLGELEYYMKMLSKPNLKFDKYDIVYFSFHGETHSICFDDGDVSLDELAEIGCNFFKDRYVHFGSCRTMLGSEETMANFMDKTGAKVVSGYTKTVNSSLCAIHDIALIREYITSKQLPPLFRRMNELYGGLEKRLGFVSYPYFL